MMKRERRRKERNRLKERPDEREGESSHVHQIECCLLIRKFDGRQKTLAASANLLPYQKTDYVSFQWKGKLQEKDEATFHSPSEEWISPAASPTNHKKNVVDSGASMHMVSK